jgi:ABC-type transport system involved in multi-copper enzyme maturation permease subunit
MGKQGFSSVFVAEFKRVMLRTKALVAVFVFAVIALGAFAGSIALIDWASAEAANQELTTGQLLADFPGFSMVSFLLSICLGCWASSFVSRDYNDGSVLATLTVVPRRKALFFARLLPWVVTSFVIALVVMGACMGIGLSKIGGDVTPIAIQAVLAALSVMCTCVLGFCCGTITKKGALATIAFLALFLIIPMALGAFMGGPDILVTIIKYLKIAMPGNAFLTLPDLAAMPADGDAAFNVIVSCVITLAWTIGLPALSCYLFKKRATLVK